MLLSIYGQRKCPTADSGVDSCESTPHLSSVNSPNSYTCDGNDAELNWLIQFAHLDCGESSKFPKTPSWSWATENDVIPAKFTRDGYAYFDNSDYKMFKVYDVNVVLLQ
ncbi:unnamed protein product [Caenorhabditis bovis]|uniref:Uncharacterized protein n=1 Tax=Caenorhabditis bovis TaxID=2654633 RepID=A0A8S1FD34_9PELO|nr:unnamed protein product [Caenorhabditis bovis]